MARRRQRDGLVRDQLEELPELLYREARVSDDAPERVGIDRIRAWDGEDPAAIGHDDVLALAHDLEAGALESANRSLVVDAGDARQT